MENTNKGLSFRERFTSNFIYYFAGFWSVFAVIYILGITFVSFPLENTRFADTCLGFILGTVISTLLGYFFGGVHRANTAATRATDISVQPQGSNTKITTTETSNV